jgi:hypothetical protein
MDNDRTHLNIGIIEKNGFLNCKNELLKLLSRIKTPPSIPLTGSTRGVGGRGYLTGYSFSDLAKALDFLKEHFKVIE